jgi:hypothetical protein
MTDHFRCYSDEERDERERERESVCVCVAVVRDNCMIAESQHMMTRLSWPSPAVGT